ncbi:MAG: peptidyl-prolyl cis-trans isomerase [bacterium]|nr:peptidyl-prolyl cis-trans isomerase [bacterium]
MSILRSPAFQMLVLGGLLFSAVVVWRGGLPGERTLVEIPRSHIVGVIEVFREEQGRPPSSEEFGALVDTLVEQEILFRYALDLGMQEDPAAQRRLDQIARFVAENPHEAISQAEGAQRAMELGLHESDVVIRRILADGARRLIRAVVLTRQPSEEALQEYRLKESEHFMRPGTTRISHVLVNALAHGAQSEERAQALRQRIEVERIAPADAISLGDEAFEPGVLPALSDRDLQRRFGTRFVEALRSAPVNAWSGPLRSRYGHHVVFVHERNEPQLPPLSEIEEKVRRRLLHEAADEWLELRVQQLRASYEIVLPEIAS